jgi:protein-tyrosine phosphatase
MSAEPHRHIRLTGAFNVRDLGGYRTAAGGITRWRSLLRADALHELDAEDVEALIAMGLGTVVDLRSDAELRRQPSRLAADARIDYRHIPLFDGLAPVEAMVDANGGFDMALRYRTAADSCAPALARVATSIADAGDEIVLFNCSAGKDRTGIVAAMLLSLAGVGGDDVAADYALTQVLAAPLMDRLWAQAVARGLAEGVARQLLSSEPATIKALLNHVEDRHGGFAAYLAAAGLDSGRLGRISARLA